MKDLMVIFIISLVLSSCLNQSEGYTNSNGNNSYATQSGINSLSVGDIISVNGRDALVLRTGSQPKAIYIDPEYYNLSELENISEQSIPSVSDWRMISEKIYGFTPTVENFSCPLLYNGIGSVHYYSGVHYPINSNNKTAFRGHGDVWCRDTENVYNYIDKQTYKHRLLFNPIIGNTGCTYDKNKNAILYKIIYL